MLKYLCVLQDLVINNNNKIAYCIFYLIKKSNQAEDGA